MSALHFTAWRQSYKVEARRLAETTNKREGKKLQWLARRTHEVAQHRHVRPISPDATRVHG
jgi:hypothetical protein